MTGIQTVRIGSRNSDLSRRQTARVVELLARTMPGLHCEVEFIVTTGDRLLDRPLPEIGGKGVFTEELETALLDGRIDLAVHSLKDLPVTQRDCLVIGAVPERADVTDSLISRAGAGLDDLPESAVVGTSSHRRAAQLLRNRRDLQPQSIRGNVETRVHKALDPAGPYDAIVLATAGLQRLGLTWFQTEVIPLDLILPAPGQGALAVQCRDEPAIRDVLAPINDRPVELATIAERAFLAGLGGGCSAPVAALGTFHDETLSLRGRVLAIDGSEAVEVELKGGCGSAGAACEVGLRLAQAAIDAGAVDLLGAMA